MKLAEIIANNAASHFTQLVGDHVLAGEIQTRLSQLGGLAPPADGQFGPVSFFTENPLNPGGAARIAFGQYKSWVVGIHNIASAGCLVAQSHDEHKRYMALVKTDPRFQKASQAYVFMTAVIAGDDLKNKIG